MKLHFTTAVAVALVLASSFARADEVIENGEEQEQEPEPPPQAPASASSPEPPQVVPPKQPTLLRGELEGGVSANTLFGLGWRGTHVSGDMSLQRSPKMAVVLGASGDFGRMPTDLAAGNVTVFVGAERVFDRLRLGAAGSIAFFWMSRIPSDDAGPITAAGIGVRGLLTVDLFRFDDETRAIYISGVPELELLRGTRSLLLHGDIGVLLRAGACAGVRF